MRGLMFVWMVGACGRIGFDAHGDANHDGAADAYAGCPVIAAAAGREHTCAVDAKGQVWCFGRNDLGQVEFGGPPYLVTPTLVPLPTAAVQVAAGRDFTCARLVDGNVWCWGDGALGQHGDSTATSGGPRMVALGTDTAVDLAVGAHTACVVRASDHAVACWGAGQYFQDGQTTMTNQNLLVAVPGTAGSQKVKLGHRNGCALLATGELDCWGRNYAGQLATNDTTDRSTPVRVGNGAMRDFGAGGNDTCVVDSGGTVQCAGVNSEGQLGTGDFVGQTTLASPVVTGATAVAVSSFGSCAIVTGKLTCWGDAGPGDALLTAPTTIAVDGVTDVMAGYYHLCAIYGGALGCWGGNDWGQLGRGFRSPGPTPNHVMIDGVTMLAVNNDLVCALSAGELYCWGDNAYGELADGTLTSSAKPKHVNIGALATIDGVTVGEEHVCAWGGGEVACWGRSDNGRTGVAPDPTKRVLTPTLVTGLGAVTSASAGVNHGCAIDGGTVKCWGANNVGQLGDGSTTASLTPVTTTATNTTQLSVGDTYACAISNGGLVCWGQNGAGQIGDGSKLDRHAPVAVVLPGTAAEVAAGASHTCAINMAGSVYCWGRNTFGELGLGDTNERLTPTLVTLPASASHISVAKQVSCAVLVTSEVYCWGTPNASLLTVDGSLQPIHVAAMDGAADIHAAFEAVCSRTATGSVFCWGASMLTSNVTLAAAENNPAPAAIPVCP